MVENLEEQNQIKNSEDNNKPRSFFKGALFFVAELAEIIIISLAIIIPIRYFLVQPFYVKGASMEPNYYDSEYLIVDELSYRFKNPERGEVVVFKYPLDTKQYFIKRIVGLPNETITIGDGKILVVSDEHSGGIFLDENLYISDEVKTYGDITMKLDEDEYLVLGDNRGSSLDSRNFGSLPEKLIIGKVLFRGWPLARAGLFDRPEYAGFDK